MRNSYFILVFLALAFIWSCLGSKVAGGGIDTETSGGKISGTIQDSSGVPVSGAQVTLVPKGYQATSDSSINSLPSSITSSSGEYFFDVNDSGLYNIEVEHQGKILHVTDIEVYKDSVILPPSVLINPGHILLVFNSGENLKGGGIYISGTTVFRNIDSGLQQVVLDSIPPGIYSSLYFLPENGGPILIKREFEVNSGATTVIQRVSVVTGFFIDENDQPVSNKMVELIPVLYNPVSLTHDIEILITHTDNSGMFNFLVTVPGDFNLVVIDSLNQKSVIQSINLDIHTDTINAGLLRLSNSGILCVSLSGYSNLLSGAAGIEGTNISKVIDIESWATGTLIFNNAPVGFIPKIILYDSTKSQKVTLEGESRLTSGDTLKVGNTISSSTILGVIKDSMGNPLSGVLMTLTPSVFDPNKLDSLKKVVTTGTSGEFIFDSVDPGIYTLYGLGPGGKGILLNNVLVDEKTEKRISPLTLGSLTSITIPWPDFGNPNSGILFIPGTPFVNKLDSTELLSGEILLHQIPLGIYDIHYKDSDQKFEVTLAEGIDVSGAMTLDPYHLWTYSKNLVLSSASTAGLNGLITDFPLFLNLNSNNFDFSQSHELGVDLRFTNHLGERLEYEIELWDPSNRTAALWIKMDSIHPGTNKQFLKMYWGNRLASSVANSEAVFDTNNGIAAVWHMAQNFLEDATVNNNDLVDWEMRDTTVISSGTRVTTTHLGRGRLYAEKGSGLKVEDSPSLGISNEISISAWFYSSDTNNVNYRIMQKGFTDLAEYGIYVDSNIIIFELAGITPYRITTSRPTNNVWHLINGTYDGNTISLYMDGELVTTRTASGAITQSTDFMSIGNRPKTPRLDWDVFFGIMDEVRIETVGRSADWVKLSYQSQRPENVFLTFE